MKDRLLNFLLAFSVFLLIFNFLLPKPEKPAAQTGVSLSVASRTLTVPNVPVISVSNATASGVSFDTCADLEILKDYRKINLDGEFSAFCRTEVLNPGEKKALDVSVLAPIFSNPGQYAFKLKSSGGETVADAVLEERGFFRNLFSELFYRPVFNLFVYLIEILPGHSL